MTRTRWAPLFSVFSLFIAIAGRGQNTEPLRLAQTFPLPQVEGRIDHLAVDLSGQRLFVAALGNNTLEVIDLRTGSHVHSISGLREPQGISFVPDLNRLFVANGHSGAVDIFDGTSFKTIGSVRFSDDADNLRYDATSNLLYVGYGDGGLGIVDAASGQLRGDIRLAAHPESFQLEASGSRIFANVPNANQIVVIGRAQGAVTATWPLTAARANFPMALDESERRLFVGFRKPARLGVFDTQSGKVVADLESAGDADDLFYDRARRRIYLTGGEGFLDVFEQRDADHYTRLTKLPTAAGARTGLFVPEHDRLYLAVPHRGTQVAEVRVYAVQP